MFEKSLILLWIFHFCVVLISGASQGEQCSTRTNEPGVCSTVPKCPSILNDLRQGKVDHTVCTYEGFEQIVCCPSVVTESTTRISVKKCNEYNDFAYSKVFISSLFGGDPVEKKVLNCAFRTVSLIGGTEVKHREFPHMALIGYKDNNTIRWLCGGTLISEQFVLSAAHCLYIESGPAMYVRLGDYDLSRTDEAAHVDIKIIERIGHPNYKYPSQYNDIGLFKLERRVELNGAIRPACLPDNDQTLLTKRAIVSGWRKEEWKESGNNILEKVTLDIFSQEDCNSTYGRLNKGSTYGRLNKGIVEETQVCAKGEEKNNCEDHSGDPLQVYHLTQSCSYTIVGVNSFGNTCLTLGPSVYTRVYAYLNWIEGIVWPNEIQDEIRID